MMPRAVARMSSRPYDLIRCKDDDEWLRCRRMGVGGSDVAAIMGLSPWRSPIEVWADKTGRAEPEDMSGKPWIEWGNLLEPLVGRKYGSEHPERKVRRLNAICRSTRRPWALASLDYEVRDPALGWGVLEIKTAHDDRAWADGVPVWYLTQVTHYMSVTDRPFADVAVLIGGSDYREYRVTRDEDDVAAVNAAVDTFWHDYVERDVMPEVVGTSGEAVALTAMHRDGDGMRTVIDSDVDERIAEYQGAQERCKAAEDEKRLAANALMKVIGDSKGIVTDTSRVTWVRTERTSVDAKMLAELAPEVYEQVTTRKTTSGGIRISDIKR